jgi:hypothetical protein
MTIQTMARSATIAVPRIERFLFPASMIGADGSDLRSVMQDRDAHLALFGAMPRGIHSRGDIVTTTPDGVDLNRLWNEFQQTMGLYNAKRDSLVQFLTFPVSVANEFVYQGGSLAEMEDATEYGLPVGYRPDTTYLNMGYDFRWKDIGGYFTWQFLADAPSNQVQAFNNMAMEADNRSVFKKVMNTLFNNTRRTNSEGNVVYPFYNGQNVDALDTPPVYGSITHAAGHNHFLTLGATLEPADVEGMQNHLTHHGYRKSNGNTLVLMVNQAQGDAMRNWRSTANGGTGLYDFIPAQNTPAFLMPVNVRTEGGQVANTYQGLGVIGSYGEFLVVQEDYIPTGYLVGFATGGQDSLSNPVGFREHATASLRGLRLVKGRTPDYPLIDSVYNHGFGTGVRHRGGTVIGQMTAGAYSIPAEFV